jgi:hypothetical protein
MSRFHAGVSADPLQHRTSAHAMIADSSAPMLSGFAGIAPRPAVGMVFAGLVQMTLNFISR